MLQVSIYHHADKTSTIACIQDVTKDSTVTLAEYDSASGKIDLDVCLPFVGNEITIMHSYENIKGIEHSQAVLQKVDVDENNIKFIAYTPVNI